MMSDEVLFLGEDAPRVVSSLAAHLSPSQQFGAGLILVALALVLLVLCADLLRVEQGPRR